MDDDEDLWLHLTREECEAMMTVLAHVGTEGASNLYLQAEHVGAKLEALIGETITEVYPRYPAEGKIIALEDAR